MKKEVLIMFKALAARIAEDIALPEANRLKYALRINEILAEELKNDVATTLRKESKLDLYKFVIKGKDADMSPVMSGVYYTNGTAVASDIKILVADKRGYPDGYEGKIIKKDGTEVAGKYPNWESVLPSDWDALTDMGTLDAPTLENAIKVADGMDKSFIGISSEHDTEVVWYASIKGAKTLLAYLKAKKAIKVRTRKRKIIADYATNRTEVRCDTIYSRDDTTQMICMGTVKPEYADNVYGIEIR